MTSTKAKKISTKAVTTPVLATQSNDISNNLVGVTDAVLKAVALLGASIIHSAPQFAFQTNQTSVVQLADVFFNYMSGALRVETPETAEAPKFD